MRRKLHLIEADPRAHSLRLRKYYPQRRVRGAYGCAVCQPFEINGGGRRKGTKPQDQKPKKRMTNRTQNAVSCHYTAPPQIFAGYLSLSHRREYTTEETLFQGESLKLRVWWQWLNEVYCNAPILNLERECRKSSDLLSVDVYLITLY